MASSAAAPAASAAPTPSCVFYCPPCQALYRSADPDGYPQLFPCGHTACAVCADAADMLDTPACPVCMKPCESRYVPDVALAAVAEAVYQGGDVSNLAVAALTPRDAATTCAQHNSPLSYFCVDDGVVLCRQCAEVHAKHRVHTVADSAALLLHSIAAAIPKLRQGATDALHAFVSLEAAQDRMLARKAASFERLQAQAEVVKAAVDAHVKSVIATVDRDCRQRLKALAAQMDALSVAANQFSCALVLCQAVVGSPVPAASLAFAAQSIQRTGMLLSPFVGPCVSTVMEAVPTAPELLKSLLKGMCRVRTAVDAKASSVNGTGLVSFEHDEDAVFQLRVKDDRGEPVESLAPEDVLVTFTPTYAEVGAGASGLSALDDDDAVATVFGMATGSPGPPTEVTHTVSGSQGVFRIAYRVPPGITAVAISCRVAGVSGVAGAPWHVRKFAPGCWALGNLIQVIPVCAGVKHGLAVSPDERWLAVTEAEEQSVVVYALGDGVTGCVQAAHIKSSKLRSPFKMCFTPAGNLLIADGKLREFTTAGAHERTLDTEDAVCVHCNDRHVVVGKESPREQDSSAIEVRSWSSATSVLYSFGEFGSSTGEISGSCRAVRLTPDGKGVVAADNNSTRLLMFSVEGSFLMHICVNAVRVGYKDVDFSASGEIIVADVNSHRVAVFSPDGKSLVRSWGSKGTEDGEFRYPTALAVAGSRLYVMDRSSPRVQVFL